MCDYKCKYDGRKCNSNQKGNNNKCPCGVRIQRKIVYAEHILIGILTCAFAFNSTYTKNLTNDSIVTFDGIVEAVANSYVDLSRNCDKWTTSINCNNKK